MMPEHRLALATLNHLSGVGSGWCIAQPSLAEFWSVATHPAAAGRPSSVAEVRAFLGALLSEGGAQLCLPGPGFAGRLLAAATQLDITGPRIFDLQIALIALEHGATEIWSHDRGFVSVPGLPVHDPLRRRGRSRS
jgi:hypothetical protein